eukprot:GFUD01001260.1.p1 GENE.GFUD01001260.1~~GFUD01001260.1.p1  ORF type:complete len:494 (+),score=107.84 GFUD01001260.1:94-1575(+)
MGTVTVLTLSSIGSPLDLRIRREARKSKAFLQSARSLCVHSDKLNQSGEMNRTLVKSEMAVVKKSAEENVEDLSIWLKSLSSFDSCGRTIEQLEGIRVGALPSSVSKEAERFDPMTDVDDEFYTYTGGKDADQECHGNGVLEYDEGTYLSGTWTHGKREGYFRFDTANKNSSINYMEGNYKDDELYGKVRIQLRDETWMEGFFKNSVLHGFCRYFDKQKQLTFIGMHRNGKPFGTCWKIMKGGGYVVGRVNEDGQLSGNEISYIFPDLETALVGTFEDAVLKEAKSTKLSDVTSDYGCIKVPNFYKADGATLCRELSTTDFVTNSPLLKDPYEEKTVFVKQSHVEGAQEGLFSKHAVKANTVMAFYNGIRRKKPENGCPTWQNEANAYKIFDPNNKEGVVDILEKYHSYSSYCASLAHKTNHSFIPNCEFSEFNHPRWGLVPCIQAMHDLSEGEELFVWYGYDLDYCPDWYLDAWEMGNFTVPDSMKLEYGVG